MINLTKEKFIMKKFAVLLAALLMVACSSTKPTPTAAPAPSPINNSTSKPTATSTTASTAVASPNSANSKSTAETASEAKLAAEIMRLHKESVYFDYDKYDLKPEFKSIVNMQAASFKSRKNAALVLEGNADERGSAAYNVALGEKRANSVKKALVILGIPASKIKVVSYGNTRPLLDCHEEKCYQENRRVDFVFKQK